MPADYNSTARALALPISPIASPSPESENNARPAWTRRISTSTRRAQQGGSHVSLQSQIIDTGNKVQRRVLKYFNSLSLIKRILAVLVLTALTTLSILFLVYSERIFHLFAPVAKKWHDMTGGWLIVWALTFITGFPPLIGYSTAVTIAGFVYGFPNGWYIVATATVAGSLGSFVASRTILSSYVHRLVGKDKRFEALALTLKHDGLKILCMIRLCPLPYSISNAAMSTFPTIHPASFALATAITTPKLLIHVFIGSRLAIIAESGDAMDAGTKAMNYASMAFGGIVGGSVGYMIYSRTMARAKELEIEELEAGRRGASSASAPGGYDDDDADEGDLDAAALMDDDDISLWDNDDGFGGGDPGYRDEVADEEDVGVVDVFASGDQDGPPRKKQEKAQQQQQQRLDVL